MYTFHYVRYLSSPSCPVPWAHLRVLMRPSINNIVRGRALSVQFNFLLHNWFNGSQHWSKSGLDPDPSSLSWLPIVDVLFILNCYNRMSATQVVPRILRRKLCSTSGSSYEASSSRTALYNSNNSSFNNSNSNKCNSSFNNSNLFSNIIKFTHNPVQVKPKQSRWVLHGAGDR